jgi:DNA double-strand break repair helicase HerA and related ATPase
VWIAPPASQIGPIADTERDSIRRKNASVYGHYDQAVDRESAYEKLMNRTAAKTEAAGAPPLGASGQSAPAGPGETAGAGTEGTIAAALAILFGTTGPRGGKHDGLVQSAAKSAARSVGSGVGRAILRGALGSILGGSTARRR